MIRHLKHFAAMLLASLGFVLPASATTFSTDYTDLWFNPSESGWGVNLIQQSDTIFATLFVYGADSSARWFVASGLTPAGNSSTYSGTLYQTTGPYFGAGSFNPAAVTLANVGTMTLSFGTATTGTLSYTVNGVAVTKSIQRQTWKLENLTGHYLGGLTAIGQSCRSASNPSGAILVFDTLGVSHSGTAITLTVDFTSNGGTAARCTYSGTYSQAGRFGSISGNFTCVFGGTTGNQGTFTMTQVDAGVNGFNSSFTGSDQFCSYGGQFGGVKDVF